MGTQFRKQNIWEKIAHLINKITDFCTMSQAGDNGILQRLRSNRPTIIICGMVLGAHFGWRWLQNQPGVRHPDAPIDQDVREDWPIVRLGKRLMSGKPDETTQEAK